MKVIVSSLARSNIKRLSKKYKSVISDIDSFINDIQSNTNITQSRIQGIGNISVYKTRVKNSSITKGKSGGFRVIYHLKIDDALYILSIYSKNDIGNIDSNEIIESLKELGF